MRDDEMSDFLDISQRPAPDPFLLPGMAEAAARIAFALRKGEAIGIFGDYRRVFWSMAWPALRAGRIEELIQVGLVAHHMIVFARDCASGRESASFYAERPKAAAAAAEPATARAA